MQNIFPNRRRTVLPTIAARVLATSAAIAGTLSVADVASAATVLVAEGSAMTYRSNSSDPGLGTTWTAEAFVPSGWSAGTYGVGYETGSGAANLLTTTVPGATNSVYTRTTFDIADVNLVNNLFLGADYDDGYVAWINGVEVYRSPQMPGGAPAWNTAASLHESSNGTDPDYTPLQDITTAALGAIHNGANVLAIGVWNGTLPSSDLVLVPQLTMNEAGSVTRGPYLQLGTPTSVVVRWRTNLAGDSCVDYGASPGNLVSQVCDGSPTTEHEIELTGLTAATTYYYSVGTSSTTLAGDDADHVFTTSPTPGTDQPTHIWVLGDSGTADANAEAVRDAYDAFSASAAPDLWLMLGDNAYNSGTDNEFQAAVFDMYPTTLRRSVLWPTLGNHDGASANSNAQTGPYYDIFTLPTAAEAGGLPSGTEAYYSFDYANIHFVCLDSYETDRSPGGSMLLWLEADLADTTADWIVAFFHHPPYSKGSHDSDSETALVEMRENALPILEDAGVDLVLTGHSHSYERSYLLDGHYDVSTTFTALMQKDAGDGQTDGDGAYVKPGGGPVAHEGAVYVVAGSSGQVDSGSLNHPAMFVSMAELGSLVLDIDGNQLDAQFLDDLGSVLDHFTIVKAVDPVCGNSVVEAGEDCDDGNADNTDACLGTCVAATCGDGFTRAGVEECDDGNMNDADGCSNACLLASCGDGSVQVGEECDDGNADNTDACLDVCQNAFCGDGFVRAGIEECDDGNVVDTDACTAACTVATCGDGIVQSGVEECDDGNLVDTDACLGDCVVAACGDGFVEAGVEECDDGNLLDTDSCTAACLAATCGDGIVEAGVEECDDGNNVSGDGCSAACAIDCDPQPRVDCRTAGVSLLKVSSPGDPARSTVKWKWRRGEAFAAASIGDPTAGGAYNVCFYPNVPGAGALAAAILLPMGPAWLSREEKGYSYRDSTMSVGGVRDLRLGAGIEGRTQVSLRAKGASIPGGLLPATSYTVQLIDVAGGGCWSSAFASGDSKDTSFKGKTKLP